MAIGWRGQYYKYREFSINLLAIYKQRADVQAFLEIILSLGTLIIFIIFAIKPTVATMISLNKEIESKKSTLDSLNQKISDLQAANSTFSENQRFIPSIDTAIFSLPMPNILSKQILGVAAKNGISIQSLSIGQATIVGQPASRKEPVEVDTKPLPDNAQALSVTINSKGDYTSLLNFLTDLENLRIPIKIDNLSMNASQLASGGSLVQLISARVPYVGR